jgi:NADH-quinone oxidoreductase subunit L
MFDVHNLMILVPALPLAAAVLTALLGRYVLREQSHIPTVLALALSFIVSLGLVVEVRRQVAATRAAGGDAVGWEQTHTLWTWANVTGAYQPADVLPQPGVSGAPSPTFDFTVDITLRTDSLTAMMLAMVTFISTLVAIYASGYMRGDRGYWRFFCYFPLFVFSMTMLVSVSNFVLLYVFWEAVGLCSYLLVGFWYEKPAAAAAAKKAFLVNRVGDFGFALGVFLIWTAYGTLNFHDAGDVSGVLGQSRLISSDFVTGGIGLAICLLLFVGACGKSAQFPLHVWLPDAMEGPTPVSALIHAATMVTAGVYLVARCAPLFLASAAAPAAGAESAWWANPSLVVAIIATITLTMAGVIAVTQTDLKRVLAYSTVSQLGYMFLGVGTASLAGITAGMFHLLTHAFFKALLFLGAGSVMHAMGNVIDMQRFSGLRRVMPTTHWTFLFGALALAGVVPFAGFWSKDEVLAAVYHTGGPWAGWYQVLFWTSLFGAGLTAFYTFRAYFLTFHGPTRIPVEAGDHAHESPAVMTIPLGILAFFALSVGATFAAMGQPIDFLSGAPSLAWVAAREAAHASTAAHAEHAGMSHFTLLALSTVVALSGVGLAAYMYLGEGREAETLARKLRPLYRLSHGKFFIDQIYQGLIVWPLQALARLSYWIDRNVIDGLVNVCGHLPRVLGAGLRSLQGGLTQFYALAMVLGVVVLVAVLLKWPG